MRRNDQPATRAQESFPVVATIRWERVRLQTLRVLVFSSEPARRGLPAVAGGPSVV